MPRFRLLIHVFSAGVMVATVATLALGDEPIRSSKSTKSKSLAEKKPPRMDFRNNVLPGELNSYEVRRATRRSKQISKSLETFSYQQIAVWTQINIADPQPATAVLYQMMADQPAKVLGFFRDDKQLKSAPVAAVSLLSTGSTRLESTKKTIREYSAIAPRVDSPERIILELLLDVAHWPAKPIQAGHKWDRDIKIDGFDGKQTFEFVDLVKANRDTLARVTLLGMGRLTGAVGREFEFGKVQAIIHWSRLDQRLERIEAQASYHRRRLENPVEYDMTIEVVLVQSQRLTESSQERVKQQVVAINGAAKEAELGHARDAAKRIAAFVQQWPESPWMPVIADLRHRVEAQGREDTRLSNAQLQKSLANLFVQLEAADEKNDDDARDSSVRLLASLAADYRARLRKHAESDDEQIRGLAAFAMAFAPRPADFALAEEACSDRAPRVRTLAITGIAASRRPNVRAEILFPLFDDATIGIRARAADAVAACIAREDLSVQQLIEALDLLMVQDDSDVVRHSAIRAIAAIGGPSDIPRLEKALSHEMDRGNRAEIQRAIEQLNSQG